mgnify:CR=1 FL=1
MAEFKVRKLFQLGASDTTGVPESYESVWAYSVRYPHTEYSTPGRYRIRITKMTAQEFITMMGGDPATIGPTEGYSIQGYIEKWTDKGWLHCLDWIGNPDASYGEIEQDLNDMFQAFTTGVPTEKKWEAPVPPRPPPIDRTGLKKPKFTVVEGDKPDPPQPASGSKDESPDFDWI